MLDHGISWLPVVQTKGDLLPVGCLRGEKIGSAMIRKLGEIKQMRPNAA